MTRLWILIGLFAGCAVDAAPEPASGDSDTVTLTAVQLGADGTQQITRRSITAAQRDALIPSGTAPRTGSAAARRERARIEDDPCALPSLFLFDRTNQEGNVLCIVGTGTFEPASFVHHWELVSDFFGDFWIPVSWQGQVASAWTTFFSAEFFEDGEPDPVHALGPQQGENFIHIEKGVPTPERISSVVVF